MERPRIKIYNNNDNSLFGEYSISTISFDSNTNKVYHLSIDIDGKGREILDVYDQDGSGEFKNSNGYLKCNFKEEIEEPLGERAKRFGMTVGSMGCSNCGIAVYGALTSTVCEMCGHPYFKEK